MSRDHFADWIVARNLAGFYLCAGIDPENVAIPPGVSLRRYVEDLVDAVAPYVACIKPNAAFFECRPRATVSGLTGQETLVELVRYIHERQRDLPVLADAKRGDVPHTNRAYVRQFFDWYDVDAMTVNPYLGGGAMEPFFEREERGVIVLCRTSNPESDEIQMRPTQVDPPILGENVVPNYQYVAYRAANHWNGRGNCGLVVGATYPEEAEKISQIAPAMFKLLPGIGDQGGGVAEAVRGVFVPKGAPAVFNSSRGLANAWDTEEFGHDPENFAQAAGKEAQRLNQALVDEYRRLQSAA